MGHGEVKSSDSTWLSVQHARALTFQAIGNGDTEVRFGLNTESMNGSPNPWKSMVFQFRAVNKVIMGESVEEDEGSEL